MKSRNVYRVVEILSLLAFLIYIVLRAVYIPITHDEAGSILNFSSQSVWDIITYKEPIPNNHLLNTLLIKLFTNIFGMYEWVCRLPNIIAGLVYFIFGQKILKLIFPEDFRMQCISMILLIANPYLVEFFSLARGYGLSIGLMMISIYYLLNIVNGKNNYFLSILFAGLSVYANLTLLNYFAPLLVLIIIHGAFQKPIDRNLVIKVLAVCAILVLLLTIPILKMIKTNQFQYWQSNGFYQDTLIPLLRSSIQGKAYFSQYTEQVFLLLITTSLVATLWGLFSYFKNSSSALMGMPIPIIFLGAICYNILQKLIFHIPYLNARTSLFFYPLFILSVCFVFSKIHRVSFRKIGYTIIVAVSILCFIHIVRCYNLKSSYEWWFDADNSKIVSILDRDAYLNHKSVSFKCNWLFQPSMTFYTKGQHRSGILPPPYNKSIDSTEVVDYYLITSDDKNPWLIEHYDTARTFGWNTRFLMKKKTIAFSQ